MREQIDQIVMGIMVFCLLFGAVFGLALVAGLIGIEP